ncbi:MAG: serine/threonine-protein kinase [Planctomycetota bacterium]|nr:MAG: serine/threonine-protein kinase [Planctomycetota bacterium]
MKGDIRIVRTVNETGIQIARILAANPNLLQGIYQIGVPGNFDSIVGEYLGGGAQGAVFRAKHCRFAHYFAIKFVKITERRERERFERELSLGLKASAHACVCTIFDGGLLAHESTQFGYYVSQLMSESLGAKLQAAIAVDAPLGLLEKLEYLREVMSGLAYIHDHGLAHRDLKPENVFIGDDDIARLGDFGFAKDVAVIFSGSFQNPGTPDYQAPEIYFPQYKPDDKTGLVKCDVFSAGVMVFRVLFERVPFNQGTNLDKWLEEVMTGFRLKSTEAAMISPKLQEMLIWMLKADPIARWSARKCLDVLDHEVKALALNKSRVVTDIRGAISKKMEAICDFFADEEYLVAPKIRGDGDDADWYMTVLLRSVYGLRGADGSSEPRVMKRTLLYPVYLPHYEGSERKHWADWMGEDPNVLGALWIDRCCSGLVIDFHDQDKRKEWQRRNWYKTKENKNPYVEFVIGNNNRVRYVVLKGIKDIIGKPQSEIPVGSNLIYERYVLDHDEPTERGAVRSAGFNLGFHMRDADGNHHKMRSDISVAIVVPVYAPLSPDRSYTGDSVVGVVNFEWVEDMDDGRIRNVGEQLSNWIQAEHRLQMTTMLAELVELVATPAVREPRKE